MHKAKLLECLRPLSRGQRESALLAIFEEICVAIDTPRSLCCYMLLKYKQYDQLVSMEIDASRYSDAHSFADDYLVTKFLSKYPDFKHENLNPESKAMESFSLFEDVCKATNKKFQALELDPSSWDPEMREIFLLARRKISSVLGFPNLERISDGFGWGPGATTSSFGSHTSAYVKFQSRLDVTSNSLIMGHCCINSTPAWVNCQLQTGETPSVEVSLTRDALHVVRGNEVVFVPKNAKTHRIIAKEPHVNSYLQKGFGSEIRRLLRLRAGIDLKDQTANQRLARLGSLTGSLATIDLSGASDTISRELVKYLLPNRWYTLLDSVRSKQGLFQGEWFSYEKFSSMGNAATFELESLIFWALCSSACEVMGSFNCVSVYGDDIIIPVDCYELVARVIDFAGFRVNESKSFFSGPFRESCGKDYFNGVDVRPIFLKESISNAEVLIKVANAVRRYAHRRNLDCGCDVRFERVWNRIVGYLPPTLLSLKVPEGVGDCGLLSNFDEACPSRPSRGWGGYVFKALLRVPVKKPMSDWHAGYTVSLSAAGRASGNWTPDFGRNSESVDRLFPDYVPFAGRHDLRNMTIPKVARIHVHGWRELGPWS